MSPSPGLVRTALSASPTTRLHAPTDPIPTHPHDPHAKRHFYECAGQTLSWHPDWYTQAWFTSSRASYDAAASLGPVSPPGTVIATVPACEAALSAASLGQARSEGRVTTLIQERTSDGVLGTVTLTSILSVVPSPTATSSSSGVLSSGFSSLATVPTLTGTLPPSSSTQSVSTVSKTSSAVLASATDPMSINSCAGQWDWQASGVIASLGVDAAVGAAVWLLWAVLRSRLPGFFSPRSWLVPPESTPAAKWSLIAFLLPFLRLPSLDSSIPLSTPQLALPLLLAFLKLAALTSLLSLASLPLLIAGVPCLSLTAPSNTQGGRLGTLTDLSLLRLLNALDPSPSSIRTSGFLHLQPYARDLPSTIRSAISTARVRLIIVLVIIGILGIGGGLFVIARAYAALARYKRRFEEDTCKGMDMVYLPAGKAKGLHGMNEEKAKRWFTEWSNCIEGEDGSKEVEVIGLFAIPDTSELLEKVKERAGLLDQLEQAEADYLELHTPSAGPHVSSGETHSRPHGSPAPSIYYQLPEPNVPATSPITMPNPPSRSPSSPSASEHRQMIVPTKFVEINRDSGLFDGKRFSIGQRVRVDKQGLFVPDSSPESEGTNPLGSQSGHGPTPPSEVEGSMPTQPGGGPTGAVDSESRLRMGPARRPEMHESHVRLESARPSQDAEESETPYTRVEECRAAFMELNRVIEGMQERVFAGVVRGEDVLGWVVVGRGVKWLPFAQEVAGRSGEDIIWENILPSDRPGKPRDSRWISEGQFWVAVLMLGIMLAISIIPFIGLTVATAPGFAHYLDFMRPLAESDAFASAVAESLAPAIAVTLLTAIVIWFANRAARRVRTVSRVHRELLAYKATFYLLLSICLIWLLLSAALEFAVQGFATGVQRARVIGDGSIYSTWFIFVLLLNLAIFIPGLMLLRPSALWRYIRRNTEAKTPRQRFRARAPPTFNPSFLLAAPLLAVFYALSLLFSFPILALPILLLLYLSFIAIRHLTDWVHVNRHGNFGGAALGLWTVRRLGWVLPFQPGLLGLIMLSRREWALGGASLGVACVALVLSELLTVGRFRDQGISRLSRSTREALVQMRSTLSRPFDSMSLTATPPGETSQRLRHSDASMLQRLNALLPGYSRLPRECPLPLEGEAIDDLSFTERAAYTSPAAATQEECEGRTRYFHDPTESLRGLIYPPEMTAPVPVVWLPRNGRDGGGMAQAEVNNLQRFHNLAAIVDPDLRGKDRREGRGDKGTREGSGTKPRTEDESRGPLLAS